MKLSQIFDALPASAEEILQNREARVRRQNSLLAEGHSCIISFSMNIPCPVKFFPLAREAFYVGLEELRRQFPSASETVTETPAGCEALLALSLPAESVKHQTVEIEEQHPLGRLFDLDVLDASGHSVSRSAVGRPPRTCLVCGRDAKLCGRSRTHSVECLQLQTGLLLNDYFRESFARRFTVCVTRAMLQEVSVTPKPGLVDRNNSGSHSDMDFSTFMDSAATLSPWFHDFFCIGWEYTAEPITGLFDRLRFLGRQAEKAMFAATGGVNTHKGLLFSFCILCGAAGALQSRDVSSPLRMDALIAMVRELGTLSLRDFSSGTSSDSNGQAIYRSHQLKGVRGESAEGFPSVLSIGLPALRSHLHSGRSLNDAAALTLLTLLAQTDDTNMVHRGGFSLAQECKQEAQKLLQSSPDTALSALTALDETYRSENLSPGGCADLLSLTLAFHFLLDDGLLT